MIKVQAVESMMLYVLSWLEKYVLNWSCVLQLAAIIVISAIAWVSSRNLSRWLVSGGKSKAKRSISFLLRHIHLSSHEILLLLLLPLMMGIAVLVTNIAGWFAATIGVAAHLITAWAFIRIITSVIQQPFWSMTITCGIWIVTALKLIGWLDPVAAALDGIALTMGDSRISVLLVIRGLVRICVLMWLARVISDKVEKVLNGLNDLTPSQKVLFQKLIRIALFGFAILIGLKSVGIDLTAFAVFTGAIGIGIGFGLQSVFSNIISGFILLLDKSIKPGDVIAIGDTYGWVNCLGTRYVSILTRDGKEHLIPNESLITAPVENWSYSDNKVRIHIPIGVSYKSDIHDVKRLMLAVVAAIPRILKTPAPACFILEFGDNSINFELRVWIEDPANGVVNVRSDVYEGVWDAFKLHNIELPFPQRDVHLHTVPERFISALERS